MAHELYRTGDPVADAERYANRDMPTFGICEQCKKEIYKWEDHYHLDDDILLHDDCVLDWLRQFRVQA